MGRATAWLTEAVPRARLAWFRTVAYLFIAADLVWFTPWVRHHGQLPADFYRPLLVGRLAHLPIPTGPLVEAVYWLLLTAALAAATGRAPRLLGWTVFVLYAEWMVVAMSYGKVDHDRFALLVALAALPTAGPAAYGDRIRTERGGWALRVTQLAAVATYFLSAWAKLRFGGPQWLTSATLTWALLRRGTPLGQPLTDVPGLLVAAQFGIMAFELLSPLVFVLPRRWRHLGVAFFYAFHLCVFATTTISFIPQLVALTSFLPLERLGDPRRRRALRLEVAGERARERAGGRAAG
nr:MFS transporter permease [Planosporangium thailandense]